MKHLLLWLSGLLLISNLQAAPSLPASVFFVPNLGQWDGAFLFYYENGTLSGYVTTDGLTLDLHEPLKPQPRPENAPPLNPPRKRGGNKAEDAPIIRKGHVLMLDIVGGKQEHIEGTELLASYSNYFLSRDSCRWRGHVPNYQSLLAREVWPGIDIEYRATLNGIETVFHVQPGADPSLIQMRYRGADAPISVDANGRLQLVTSMGTIFEQAPFAFQILDHSQQSMPVAYHLLDDHTYNLTLGSYDRSRELVIDPLVYSTYFPAEVSAVSVDSDSNKIVCGRYSGFPGRDDFPTTPGAYEEENPNNSTMGVISKLNPGCTEFLFSTYFSGMLGWNSYMVTDSQDRIWIFANTRGARWPLTVGAFDTTMVGPSETGLAGLTSDGSHLIYCSYLGGSNTEDAGRILADSMNRLYLGGRTLSNDLPTTSNAWHRTTQASICHFLAIFDAAALTLNTLTYLADAPGNLGGGGGIRCLVAPGVLWLTSQPDVPGLPITPDALQPDFPPDAGWMPYISLIDINNQQVLYGSYIAGPENSIRQVIPHDNNRILLTGSTFFGDMVMPGGGFQDSIPDIDTACAVYVLDLQLPSTIIAGTYLGGTISCDIPYSMARESGGTVLITGTCWSPDFPVTPDAIDHDFDSASELFLVRLSPQLDRLLYGTFLGDIQPLGSGGVYNQGSGHVWIFGETRATNLIISPEAMFPHTLPYPLFNGFIAHLDLPILPDTSNVTSPFILHPSSFSLACYPNPFNPSTKISFNIPKSGAVSLRVFDVLGREVAVLLDQRMTAGEHSVMFDADGLASGVYFARLETSGMQRVRKMVVMR